VMDYFKKLADSWSVTRSNSRDVYVTG
jgi:hypothetical protein